MAQPLVRPRDRLKLAVICANVLVLGLSAKLLRLRWKIEKSKKRERRTNDYSTRRQGITIDFITQCMDDEDFAVSFRMKRATFRKLLDLCEPCLLRNVAMGERARRPTVLPPLRLALTLRMSAGASVHDMVTTLHVDRKTAYAIFHDARKQLDNLLDLPGLPDSFHQLKKMAEDFQTSRGVANPLPGCIGALDGISIPIKKPSKDSTAYWCRKGYYALPVQAVCDANYRFLCFSAICKGATHDSLAHSVSALGRFLDEEGLQEQFWLAGDEAYVNTIFLIAPVPGSQASDVEDAFNFFHSSSRMHIEQAFRMVRHKFPILKYIDYEVTAAAQIIGVTMKLHNFCIDHNGTVPFSRQRNDSHVKAINDSEEWYKEGKHSYLDQVEENGMGTRNLLIEIIKKGNFKRPPIRQVRVSSSSVSG